MVASRAPPTGDRACDPGMCPDWELNQQPFRLQAGTQSTEPHQPGQNKQKSFSLSLFFFLDFIYLFIFRERGREGEREREKHQCVVASRAPPTGDLACNPGMCPDWESQKQPFGSQTSTQSTEPHQPGLCQFF